MLVSAVNVSEGRDGPALARIVAAAGDDLLDLHRDEHHHRSVLTVAGPDAVRRVAAAAVATIDLRRHSGVHPRLGAVDVVPFVPYAGSTMDEAAAARDAFAAWIAGELTVPAFVYREQGPTLPQVRRTARLQLLPHPTAGAVAVGARGPLVAYNVWLAEPDLALAQEVAGRIRGDGIRALGLPVGDRVQVSMNLVDPLRVGPATAYDAVAALAPVAGAELVGLVPRAVLDAVATDRWTELGLDARCSVEARLRRDPP
ncbi:MAG: Formiminotransferase domain protein [Actinomycetia bacterium]|nr:Formiminotransferase domain protein [Actinomycetes bacterium]